VRYRYPNGIGPGVYDIHPPCVPDPAEMLDLLHKALDVLQPELWVSPDCGLKTRDWPEAEQALGHMAASGRLLRSTLAASGAFPWKPASAGLHPLAEIFPTRYRKTVDSRPNG
jgi:hypothetical protein